MIEVVKMIDNIGVVQRVTTIFHIGRNLLQSVETCQESPPHHNSTTIQLKFNFSSMFCKYMVDLFDIWFTFIRFLFYRTKQAKEINPFRP